jgi:predicted P-loop ATPase
MADDPEDFDNEFDTENFKASSSSSSGPAKGGTDWMKDAATDKYGLPIPNLANALLCLRGAPELSGCFGFNEMKGEVELIEELPAVRGASRASIGRLPRPVIDADVAQVAEWMQRNCRLKKIGLDLVHQAIDRRGREYRFHPLRDWLNGLIWDRQPRVDKVLSTYFGAEDTPYTRKIGQMFLVSMPARVFRPGCQADYAIILTGRQGLLKSTALAILAGEEYFGDHMPDIHHKDSSQYLRGKWLIELPELAALNKGDVESWKAFITRREEKYRPPYGRRDVVEPRQCVFAGTTNQEEFLRDTTGNRRFWPFPAGKIDIKALERDREMLMAEAVALFKSGERWWPDRDFEQEHIAPEQETRVAIDPWLEPIETWLALTGKTGPTSFEIARDALTILTSQIHPGHHQRIAVIMRSLGWVQGKRVKNTRPWRKSAET